MLKVKVLLFASNMYTYLPSRMYIISEQDSMLSKNVKQPDHGIAGCAWKITLDRKIFGQKWQIMVQHSLVSGSLLVKGLQSYKLLKLY